ncbi:hypothetical protein AVEN_65251-1 [Araneus ventricosus]|uniref:Pituitary tumor-transforming gene 1 protein-interacting protein n=1 Tax=Araneus ventricosus TaxID=182803 RepID=A0A4Y2AFP4_ARAVE|nr:hypothetical protein AVEN_65251-1 [Araneus ventricosus]
MSPTKISGPVMICIVIISVILSTVVCQIDNETETSTGSATEVTVVSTTVNPPQNVSCETHNNDCKGCVSNSDCYYCETDGVCYFKITKVLTNDKCNLKKIHYLTCRVNFQYLMIIIGVFAGIALLIVTICCCYCCCKRRGIKISKDDLKWARQREERKQIAEERRKERAERTEEIRKKYGLVKDSNPYQRFDA